MNLDPATEADRYLIADLHSPTFQSYEAVSATLFTGYYDAVI